MNKNINLSFSKIYLITYASTFSIILFIRVSQLGLGMTSSSSKSSWFYIMYLLATFFGIFINSILSIYIGLKNIKVIFIWLSLIFLATIPNLFGAEIISLPFLLLFLFVLNSSLVNSEQFIKIDLIMRIIMLVIILFMYFCNLYPDSTYIPVITRQNINVLRYSFGFIHPNSLALFIMSIFMSYIMYFKSKDFSIIKNIFFLIIYVFISFITDSRVFQIVGLLCLILYFFQNSLIFRKIIKLIVLPISIFSLLIGIIYLYIPFLDQSVVILLNDISSERIAIGESALIYYPIKLTGYLSTPLLDLHQANIDDMYMGYMLRFGLIGFLIFQFVIQLSIRFSKKYGNYFSNICLIVMFLSIITINTTALFAPLIYVFSLRYHDNYYLNKKENL